MSYNPNYNINCNSNARNCSSGCCTSGGSCALSYQNCQYRYSDYSTSRYTFPISSTSSSGSSSEASFYLQMLALPVGLSLGYLLLILIGVIICYCRRKPSVEAINRMATHNWWDWSPIVRGNGNNPNQPAYGVNNSYPQRVVDPTYPNISQGATNRSPNRSHVLQVNQPDLNISMDRLVSRPRENLPPLQQNNNASIVMDDINQIQPIQQIRLNPQQANVNPIQPPLQQMVQPQGQQPGQQQTNANQQQAPVPRNQPIQRVIYPMPSSSFDNLSNSLNMTFNRLFQKNAPPVKLVSYQPPIN